MMMLLTLGTYCSLGTSTSLLALGELGELCLWISFLVLTLLRYSGTDHLSLFSTGGRTEEQSPLFAPSCMPECRGCQPKEPSTSS